MKGGGVNQNSIQFLNSVSRLAVYIRLKEEIKRMTQDYFPWWFRENSKRLMVKPLGRKKMPL